MVFDLIGQLVAGWLLADLLSGIFHWWQDRWPSPNNALVGSFLILPSREHHNEPGAFLHYSFWYRNYATFIGVLVFSVPLLILVELSLFVIALIVGGLVSTQVHYLAHFPSKANSLGRFSQRIGIIQSPKHHAGHHQYPHERRYCSLTDLVNPVLDELKVWDKVERLFTRLHIPLSLGRMQ